MVTFQDNERGYLRWLRLHPNGYVLNHYRALGRGYFVLHRAGCWTINGTPSRGDSWTVHYGKTCSVNRDALRTFAGRHRGIAHLCGHCYP